jgi:hypothetical protein
MLTRPPPAPRSPEVVRDLIDRVAAGEPPGGLQPQPLTPLLLGGRVPAPLRIPHALVIRPDEAAVTT